MKNWKTTLIGLAGAAVQIAVPMLQSGVSLRDITTAVIIGLLGFFAKDAGVTGVSK